MKIFLAILLLSSFSITTNASVIINATRIIYPESEKEVTVKLSNVGNSPSLVQSWIDNGNADASPDTIDVPFIFTPPLNRIEPQKSQTLRINYTGGALPSDKESVFWLNVLEIPQTKSDEPENRLQMAFRSRIKFFFRPSGLVGDANKAAESLIWNIRNNHIAVQNSSPFNVSLVSLTLEHAGKKSTIEGEMINPFSSHIFADKSLVPSTGDNLTWEYIDDWGAVRSRTIKI
ncbi:TPA: fimbria/pilus periplasmic chaperone [Citrobacter freundii]|nr:fimbria/pilus periplasmic chaperone [Citrobacter freundii]